MAVGSGRWGLSSDPRSLLDSSWLWAMVVVAVAVQGLVWGAPKSHGTGGALLPGLRHLFGLGYALILLAAELSYCAVFRLRTAAAWVLVAGACVDLAFWGARLGGLTFSTGAAAALTAGAGAVALATVVAGCHRQDRAPSRAQRS